MRVLAECDFLTGLPNAGAFEAAIARRLEAMSPFALLLGDMDGLKQINDSQGHAEATTRSGPRTRSPASAATSLPS